MVVRGSSLSQNPTSLRTRHRITDCGGMGDEFGIDSLRKNIDGRARGRKIPLHIPIVIMSISFRRMITVAMATLAIASAGAQEAKMKVATVDMALLFKEFYQTNIAQQEINVERARISKDNNEKLTTIRQIESDIRVLKQQSEDPTLSDQKKAQVYKEYQTKYQEGIQLDKERREFLGRKDKALNEKMVQRMRGILDEIRKLVEERAKAENYDFVFDKSGMSTSQVPFLLYSKDATDITPSLLKDLNKNAPADLAPAEGTPTPDEALKPKDAAPDASGGQ